MECLIYVSRKDLHALHMRRMLGVRMYMSECTCQNLRMCESMQSRCSSCTTYENEFGCQNVHVRIYLCVSQCRVSNLRFKKGCARAAYEKDVGCQNLHVRIYICVSQCRVNVVRGLHMRRIWGARIYTCVSQCRVSDAFSHACMCHITCTNAS